MKHIDNWIQNLELVKAFFERYNRWPKKRHPANAEEERLAQWRHHNNSLFKRGLLPDKHAKLFQQAGLDLTNHNSSWQKTLDLIAHFVDLHNRLPSLSAKNKAEKRLGRWRNKQMLALNNGRLNAQQANDFIKKGLSDSLLDDRFFANLKRVVQFKKKYKHLPRTTGEKPDEAQLGSWCSRNRILLKKGQVSHQRKSLLLAAGITKSEGSSARWDDGYTRLIQFCRLKKRLPSTSTDAEEKRLYRWMRAYLSKIKTLTPERQKLMIALKSQYSRTDGKHE